MKTRRQRVYSTLGIWSYQLHTVYGCYRVWYWCCAPRPSFRKFDFFRHSLGCKIKH